MEQKPSTGMQMKTIQTDFGRTIPTFSRKKSSKLSAMKTKHTQQKPIDPVESDEILRTEDDTSDFEDQIEASLNVELGFSDDQENPSEEAEEPSSSLENDVNKLEIPSEITEQLEAIREIAISPQKQLVEEALNQCSSIDNRQRRKRHIEQQPGPRIEE
ncbi:unnamed protein product [Bursaphelenchus xylophilus]|uniref:(pine wood nematode) hypothetical protein n=1 Tax=Bursaphelenchus xylophilus TaxID=6326 RepID=A0A7I8XH21_BURXY|nr:unnamed protein product [Bursaphelenchus xylophilus]CAG9079595.1 unnamed protein product [Bursaphelenchus xylophilus]